VVCRPAARAMANLIAAMRVNARRRTVAVGDAGAGGPDRVGLSTHDDVFVDERGVEINAGPYPARAPARGYDRRRARRHG